MPYIGRAIGVAGHTTQKLDDPSSISSNAFTMNVGGVAISPDASSLAIYVDGVRQEAGDAYTVSGSTLTFTGTFTASNHFHGYVMGDAMYVENNSITLDKMSGGTGQATLESSTSEKPILNLKNTNADGNSAYLYFTKDGSSAADNDILGQVRFYGENDGSNNSGTPESLYFARFYARSDDVEDGTEDGSILFDTRKAGTNTNTMALVSGQVGIGTTSPSAPLHLSQSVNGDVQFIMENTEGGSSSTNESISLIFRHSDGSGGEVGDSRIFVGKESDHSSTANADDYMDFYTVNGGTAAIGMRLTHDSKLGVGINTPATRCHIYYTGATTEALRVENAQGINSKAITTRSGGTTAGDADGGWVLQANSANGSQVGLISWASNSTTYGTSSDYRLKENQVTLANGLTRINNLKPYNFNWKDNPDRIVDGFFAHEVESVVPQAIHGVKDATNEDGSIAPQSIDNSHLVPLLVKAVQELSAKVTELENK